MSLIRAMKFWLPLAIFFTGIASAFADEVVYFGLVERSNDSSETFITPDSNTILRAGERLKLASTKGYEFDLRVTKTYISQFGNRIIHASTPSGGLALLVLDQEFGLVGSVSRAGESYSLFTDELGRSRIVKEAESEAHQGMDFVPPQSNAPFFRVGAGIEVDRQNFSASKKKSSQAVEVGDIAYPDFDFDDATISVLVYHDSGFTNVESVIDFVFEFTNTAFFKSGLDFNITLAGKKELAGLDSTEGAEIVSEQMFRAESPFEDIEADRSLYEADLVVALRSRHVSEYCGSAYRLGVYDSSPRRSGYVSTVDWQPDTSQNTYCVQSTFTHEIGHLLGGMHQYDQYDGSVVGAFSYSHAYEQDDLFRTIMAPNPTDIPLIGQFSSPNDFCEGFTCGVTDQSDNKRTFRATGHLIAGFQGDGFNYALVNATKVERDDVECEKDGLTGFWDAPAVSNQSKFDIEIASIHFVRPDSSEYVAQYDRGERYIASGERGWRGWCVTEENPTRLRTTYTETYARYYHPITGERVQLETLYWDSDYDGEYRKIRVAAGDGGDVQGHPVQVVKVDSSHSVNFSLASGYEIDSVTSTCNGTLGDQKFTVDVGIDDCLVNAKFKQFATSPNRPVISDYDYGDGAIYLRVSANDGGSEILEYEAICSDGANTYGSTSVSSLIIVRGLTNGIAYTCRVTATNSLGTSLESVSTDPITPDEHIHSLPIWLIYDVL